MCNFKCKHCNKIYSYKTGTIFENTKIPMRKWFIAIYLFSLHKKGISSHQLSRDLSITQVKQEDFNKILLKLANKKG